MHVMHVHDWTCGLGLCSAAAANLFIRSSSSSEILHRSSLDPRRQMSDLARRRAMVARWCGCPASDSQAWSFPAPQSRRAATLKVTAVQVYTAKKRQLLITLHRSRLTQLRPFSHGRAHSWDQDYFPCSWCWGSLQIYIHSPETR